MSSRRVVACLALAFALAASAVAAPPEGFVSLFDGKTLDGWDGNPTLWSVVDGTITGQTKSTSQLKHNEFLIWKDQVEDFELRLKFRIEGGNSGIYYRCRKDEKAQDPLIGTQADFDGSGKWTGVIMEYLLRGILAPRGQKVVIDEKGNQKTVGTVGDPAKLLAAIDVTKWNDYTVIAQGGHVVLKINGVPQCELDDRDPRRIVRGWLGVQVHRGPPMKVQFKDIYFKDLTK